MRCVAYGLVMLGACGTSFAQIDLQIVDVIGPGISNAAATIPQAISADGLSWGGSVWMLQPDGQTYLQRGLVCEGAALVRLLEPFADDDFLGVRAVSDGSEFAAGYIDRADHERVAVRWDASGEALDLGNLGGLHPTTGRPSMFPCDIDKTGRTVIGFGMSPQGGRGFRWREDSGLLSLDPIDPSGDSAALCVSDATGITYGLSSTPDGVSTVVGWGDDASPFDVTPDIAFRDFHNLVASSDGTALVGTVDNQSRIFRWSEDDGVTILEPSSEFRNLIVWSASSDGSVAVGTYSEANQADFFAWIEGHGFVRFSAFVELAFGMDAANWSFGPEAVSNDGTRIIGMAVFDNGNPADYRQTAFVLDLSPPCPADWNDDGSLNYFDLAAFIDAYLSGDSATDLEPDGSLNIHDITTFVGLYLAGCP